MLIVWLFVYLFFSQSLMLAERACVYNMLINLMKTREAGKQKQERTVIIIKTFSLPFLTKEMLKSANTTRLIRCFMNAIYKSIVLCK